MRYLMQLLRRLGRGIWHWLNFPVVFPIVTVVAAFVYLIERYKASLKATVVLDYLKVFLSSPVIVGAVVVLFLLMFRPAITAALGRILTVEGPGGLKATFEEQNQATEEGQRRAIKETPGKALEINVSDVVTVSDTAEARPGSPPAAATGAQQQIVKPEDRALMFARWWVFERIFRSVFLSQIQLLRYLDSRPNRQAKVSELYGFYKQGILDRGVAPTAYPWENYMRFLLNWGLVRWTPSPVPGQEDVYLTDLGVEFLRYIEKLNYNVYEKPY